MSNINFKKCKDKLTMISTSLLTGTIMITTMASCTKENPTTSNDIDISNSSVVTTTETNASGEIIDTTQTTETTLSLESYTFPWEDDENYDFDNFVKEKYGIYLAEYVSYFGLTDELNVDFTNFVNKRYNTDYEYVPFKKANYFYTYIKTSEGRGFYSDYQIFEIVFLSENDFFNKVLNNKLVLSYLAQNNIPFGYRVPIENLKALVGDDVYTCNLSKEIYNKDKFINYEDNQTFSNEELVTVLKNYNGKVTGFPADQGLKELELEGHLDVCDTWNGYLKTYFGDDAPQFGECLTKKKVIELTGGYYDLSYIDGAIYKGDTKVKGDAKVRYGDSIDEYTMSYLPGYEYYTEEPEDHGRSR